MALWLLWKANTVTAMSCFAMAAIAILVVNTRIFRRQRLLVHLMVIAFICVAAVSLFFGAGSGILQQMGREPTITGRTDIWKLVISMTRSPLLGTGFESFWLGSRLDQIWDIYWWHPNEAHNGYIEVYLNLGRVGLGLLMLILLTSYRNVITALRHDLQIGSLRLSYFVVGVVYNFTESAMRIMHPVWILFLLAGTAVREARVVERQRDPVLQPLSWREEQSWSR
jgi:O-antigen ligase